MIELYESSFRKNLQKNYNGAIIMEKDKWGNIIILWNNRYYYVDKNCNLLSDKCFIEYLHFYNDEDLRIRGENGMWNFIDKVGKLISKKWHECTYLGNFHEGYARLQRKDGLWNLINKEDKFLSQKWYPYASDVDKGKSTVKKEDGRWYYLNLKGQLSAIN